MALPKDYKIPEAGGQYLNQASLGDGLRVRVLVDPIVGTEYWITQPNGDKDKVKRVHYKKESPFYQNVDIGTVAINQYGSLSMRHWWGFVVYNYESKTVQVWNMCQKTIQQGLQKLERSADWGDFKGYDVEIELGEDGKKYTVTPSPKSQLTDEELVVAKTEASKINLEALYATEEHPNGGDPFADEETKGPDDVPVDIDPESLPF